MMNRKSTRLLTTMILAALLVTALGSVAQADNDLRAGSRATIGSKAPKPGAGPMTGEPDAGGIGGPLPPKDGLYKTGGSTLSVWAQWGPRIRWSVRVWAQQMPRRFP